jgi:hypothetical protein
MAEFLKELFHGESNNHRHLPSAETPLFTPGSGESLTWMNLRDSL